MIVFPNAKINLGLNVTQRRSDGYHNLETVFYPIYIKDVLEVVAPQPPGSPLHKATLHLSGASLEGNPNENLVIKAYHLLSENHHLPPIEVYLHKHIPSGAGLGGGSADAAFMLRLLNDLFELQLPTPELQQLAARLGADCAFFIENKPCYATGIGDVFHPIDLDLGGYHILLVKPSVSVSTREAFSLIRPAQPQVCVRDICRRPVEEWQGRLENDFETSVFPQFPELARLKEMLYESGALYASMSGSGSSLYGIYKEEPVGAETLFTDCFTWRSSL